MRAFALILLAAPLLAYGAPHRSDDHRGHRDDDHDGGRHHAHDDHHHSSCNPSPTPTCVPTTTPTKAYTVKASKPGSPIDNLSVNAGGLGFHLGGGTSSYCPTQVGSACPPGDQTVFVGGSISVLVPGGQQQYTEPAGRIGYTQAHSTYMPTGSLPGGFAYSKCPNEQYGHITIYPGIFNATGLMACPDSSFGTKQYVVWAKIPNAKVPSGNVADCIDFDGLTTDYQGSTPAAWQYT
jgi:hypothetical protein